MGHVSSGKTRTPVRRRMVDLVIVYNHNGEFRQGDKPTMPIHSDDLHIELRGDQQQVALITLNRPAKRNALNDGLILALRDIFQGMPSGVRAAVIHGAGDHFCAGLDLSELQERDAGQGLHHSRMWHAALDCVQQGPVPVVAALHGAVVGGGLELASACHIRVADETTFYALPEGSRGIFVGGGGAVRIPRLIGTARMTDMMMTGRVYNAVDGEKVGFAPCKLCWYQRIAMFSIAIISFVAALRNDKNIARYTIVLAPLGLIVSTYHYLLEWFPTLEANVCSLDVPCTAVWFRELGFVTFAFMAGGTFITVIAVSLAIMREQTTESISTLQEN